MPEKVDADVLEWEFNFGDTRPKKRATVVLCALAAGLAGLLMINLLVGIIGFFAIVFATAELFLPIKYRLDSVSATSKCGLSVTSVQWTDVQRIIKLQGGVRLSPLKAPSRLDEFRGVFLRFSDNEEDVWGKIRQFWHGDTSAVVGRADGTGDERPPGQPSEPDSQA